MLSWMRSVRGLFGLLSVAALGLGLGIPVRAEQYAATVEIVVKDKKFDPAELKAPADKRIVIHVTNRDGVAMEFESSALKVEKVVAANSEAIVRVGPLKPGRYEFFDDLNQTNRGTLIVE
jgi:heme/copper-type cytochrome/quinol oxidase subunit 2